MEPIRDDEAEFLASLEERIVRAVELVSALRKENQALEGKLSAAAADRAAAERSLEEARKETVALQKEMDALLVERKQVRTRIEKLLGQMDLLSAS